jgi:hypothetical protein
MQQFKRLSFLYSEAVTQMPVNGFHSLIQTAVIPLFRSSNSNACQWLSFLNSNACHSFIQMQQLKRLCQNSVRPKVDQNIE